MKISTISIKVLGSVLIFTAFATSSSAKAQSLVLDCVFDQENGAKGNWTYFNGKFQNSPFRINPDTGRADFYRLRDGGGLFAGGGDWTPFHDSPRLEISDQAFVLRAQNSVSSTTMTISRISGDIHIQEIYPTLGKSKSYTGKCAPGKNPETTAPPKAIF